jgi:hypothetical protein
LDRWEYGSIQTIAAAQSGIVKSASHCLAVVDEVSGTVFGTSIGQKLLTFGNESKVKSCLVINSKISKYQKISNIKTIKKYKQNIQTS